MNCIGNRIFILGGTLQDGETNSSFLYVYDLAVKAGVEYKGRDKLENPGSLRLIRDGFVIRRTMHAAVAFNDKIISIGGEGADFKRFVYVLAAKRV